MRFDSYIAYNIGRSGLIGRTGAGDRLTQNRLRKWACGTRGRGADYDRPLKARRPLSWCWHRSATLSTLSPPRTCKLAHPRLHSAYEPVRLPPHPLPSLPHPRHLHQAGRLSTSNREPPWARWLPCRANTWRCCAVLPSSPNTHSSTIRRICSTRPPPWPSSRRSNTRWPASRPTRTRTSTGGLRRRKLRCTESGNAR